MSAPRGGRNAEGIERFLQQELKSRALSRVSAVEAASWLNDAGLLNDSPHRPGQPLRVLLRAGRIRGAEQIPPTKGGSWYIMATVARAGQRPRSDSAQSIHAVPARGGPEGAFALTENDVVSAVCQHLEGLGFKIDRRAHTTEHGVDVLAIRPADGLEVRVEAKGGTSSKPGTNRFGKPFNSGQVSTHVSKAFFTASAAPRTAKARSAMAFPDTFLHRRYATKLESARRQTGVGIFWVSADRGVILDARWSIADRGSDG